MSIRMYFQIFEPLVALDLSRILKLASEIETNQAPLAPFKHLKLKQRPELNFIEKLFLNFQLCWKCVSVLFWPGLVSVCVTKETVFKEKVTREQHLVWNYRDMKEKDGGKKSGSNQEIKTKQKHLMCPLLRINLKQHIPVWTTTPNPFTETSKTRTAGFGGVKRTNQKAWLVADPARLPLLSQNRPPRRARTRQDWEVAVESFETGFQTVWDWFNSIGSACTHNTHTHTAAVLPETVT